MLYSWWNMHLWQTMSKLLKACTKGPVQVYSVSSTESHHQKGECWNANICTDLVFKHVFHSLFCQQRKRVILETPQCRWHASEQLWSTSNPQTYYIPFPFLVLLLRFPLLCFQCSPASNIHIKYYHDAWNTCMRDRSSKKGFHSSFSSFLKRGSFPQW